MFQWFENLINPFPKDLIETPPKSLLKFAWLCIKDIKVYIGLMALLTAVIASFEAILYAILASIILIIVTKTIDGAERKFGIDLTASYERLALIIEEVGEMGIPIMFAVAILSWRNKNQT